MAVICNTRVDGRNISWNGNAGSVEHSTLFGPLREGRSFGVVYDDACDEGVVVVSHKTGKEVVFAINGVDRVVGEISGWHLVSINPKSGRPDNAYKLLVIND